MELKDLSPEEIKELTIVKPKKVRIDLTSMCQLKCPACPMTYKSKEEKRGYVHFETFKKVIDENPWIEEIELCSHGEIFLNPDLIPILKYGYEKGIYLTADVGVNLNHAKPEVLEALVMYQLKSMKVSIDGASQGTYKIYRVGGNFDNVIANVKYINQMKEKHKSIYPRLNWTYIIFGHNEHEISKARELAKELKMSFLPKINWNPDYSPIRDRELVEKATGFTALTPDEHLAQNGEQVFYMKSLCFLMWHAPQINSDGRMFGCCRFMRKEFGSVNAFTDGVLESINSEEMQYARLQLMGLVPDKGDNACSICHIYKDMVDRNQYMDVEFVRELIRKSKAKK